MEKESANSEFGSQVSGQWKKIDQEISGQVFSILVLNGDDILRDLVSRTVATMGHWPLPVADVKQARTECNMKLPDLVIVDSGSDKVACVEFCRWIKQQAGGETVPVLVLTEVVVGDGKVAAVRSTVDALNGGADDFLAKPFTFQELKARLGALVRSRGLSLRLIEKNRLLAEAQERIVAQERQILTNQLAGAAAHRLGQPITAMKLNCHLLEGVVTTDPTFKKALFSIKADLIRLADMIENLKKIDAARTEEYHSGVKILEVKGE